MTQYTLQYILPRQVTTGTVRTVIPCFSPADTGIHLLWKNQNNLREYVCKNEKRWLIRISVCILLLIIKKIMFCCFFPLFCGCCMLSQTFTLRLIMVNRSPARVVLMFLGLIVFLVEITANSLSGFGVKTGE